MTTDDQHEFPYDDQSPMQGARWLLGALAAVLLYSLLRDWPDLSSSAMEMTIWGAVGLGISLLCLWVQLRQYRAANALFRAPVVYLCFFWLFHFGLVMVATLAPSLVDNPLVRTSWYGPPYTVIAIKIAALAMVSFVLGALLGQPAPTDEHPPLAIGSPQMAAVGIGAFVIGLVLALRWLIGAGGTGLFSLSYAELNQFRAADAGGFTMAVYLLPAGVLLACTAMPLARCLWVLVPFIVVMGIFAALGFRNEAMVPLLLVTAVLVRRGVRIPHWALAITVLAVLIAIPFIKAVRQVGWAEGLPVGASIGVADAFVEMGFSLLPVAEACRWADDGRPFLYGGSYVMPIERVIGRFIPSPALRTDLTADPRHLIHVAEEESGSIGFSAAAEAYCNFGYFGMVIFFLPLGWLLARLDARAHEATGIALLMLVLFPILNAVRNTMIHVPAQLVYGAVMLWLAWMLTPREEPQEVSASGEGVIAP